VFDKIKSLHCSQYRDVGAKGAQRIFKHRMNVMQKLVLFFRFPVAVLSIVVLPIGCAKKVASVPSSPAILGGTCVPTNPISEDERKRLETWLEQQKIEIEKEFAATTTLAGTKWTVTAQILGEGPECKEEPDIEVVIGGNYTPEQYKVAYAIFDKHIRACSPSQNLNGTFRGDSK
jgi:hypothetical protein